jgi:hypothetical protein
VQGTFHGGLVKNGQKVVPPELGVLECDHKI